MFQNHTPLHRATRAFCQLVLTPALLAALTAGSAYAGSEKNKEEQDDAPLPVTLEDLQRQIDELRAEQNKTAHTGSSKATWKIFGRTHLDYWDFTEADDDISVFESGDPEVDPSNVFLFRRARIGMSGSIYENMIYKTEIDFGQPGDLAFKDMFFGWKDLFGGQQLNIGNQKRPYGLDHLNSSRYNVFLERPFVIEAFNQDARRLGAAMYGLSEDQAWNWRYGVYNMNDWAKTGNYRGDTIQPEITGRIANTAWWKDDGRSYAHWALSGSLAFPDGDPANADAANEGRFRTRPEARSESRWLDTGRISNAENYTLLGVEGVANFGPTQIVAEFQNADVSRDSGDEDVGFHGGYVYVAHFLTGEHMPWSRKSGTLARIKPLTNFGADGWGAFQVAARYSYADFSDGDIFGGEGHAVTLGLNWFWNPNAGLQLNYMKGDVSDRNEDVGGTIYDDGDYEIFGLRFRVDF